MIRHPNLGNNFADQVPMTEEAHHRTLRNHDSHRLGDGSHIGGGNVTTAQSERHVHLCSHGIEVPARREHNPIAAYYETTVRGVTPDRSPQN